MKQSSAKRVGAGLSPIDAKRLELLALRYVARYATTRAKLAAFLHRKIDQAGWGGEGAPEIAALIDRLAGLGYVDDRAFAEAKAAALARRGYGARRVNEALRAAGIADGDRAEIGEASREEAFGAAVILARRRRIGPFASTPPDRAARERAIAILVRNGHDIGIARRVADASRDQLENAEFTFD